MFSTFLKSAFSVAIAAVLGAVSLHAQTITGTLDSSRIGYVPQIKQYGFVCGRSSTYCYGIPITFSGTDETLWTDLDFISFLSYPPYYYDTLGLQGYTASGGFYGAHFAADGTFYGTTSYGRAYTGSIAKVFTSFHTNGGGGRGGGGAGTEYVLLAATVTITFQ